MQAAERKAQFLKEFQELLDKHDAEFELMDNGGAYHASLSVANISMRGEWDGDGNLSNEYVEFDLPSFMTPENK